MLQAPSQISRMCAHSHYKKFWLMQTQNEAQANVVGSGGGSGGSEKKSGNLVAASMPSSTPIRGSDSKQHSSRWSTRAPSMRSLLREASSARNPNSASGARKHVSLVNCAESLSPPLQSNPTHRSSSHHTLPFLNVKKLNDDIHDGGERSSDEEDEDRSLRGSPTPNGSDVSATSSSCGSPLRDSPWDLTCADVDENTGIYDSSKSYADEIRITGRRQAHSGELDPPFVMKDYATAVKSDHRILLEKDALDSGQTKRSDKSIFSCKNGVDSGRLKSPRRFSKILDDQELLMEDFKSPGRTLTRPASDRSHGKNMADEDDCEDDLPEDGKAQDLNKCESNCGRSSLRSCSHCGTSKTPLWRSGPHGPKSLCNACGIRFKKSRRCAGSVAEGFDSHGSPPITPNSSRLLARSLKRKQESSTSSQLLAWSEDEESRFAVKGHTHFHKRSRWPIALSLRRDSIEHQEDPTGSSAESCLTWNLHSPCSVSWSPRKVFIQDGKELKTANAEKINQIRIFARDEDEEAAVLLMALSCGLVNA